MDVQCAHTHTHTRQAVSCAGVIESVCSQVGKFPRQRSRIPCRATLLVMLLIGASVSVTDQEREGNADVKGYFRLDEANHRPKTGSVTTGKSHEGPDFGRLQAHVLKAVSPCDIISRRYEANKAPRAMAEQLNITWLHLAQTSVQQRQCDPGGSGEGPGVNFKTALTRLGHSATKRQLVPSGCWQDGCRGFDGVRVEEEGPGVLESWSPGVSPRHWTASWM